MFSCGDHPDIAAAVETGWPRGTAAENQDCAEYRREFAREAFEDFLAFALDGDPALLDNFVEHYRGKYREWLN